MADFARAVSGAVLEDRAIARIMGNRISVYNESGLRSDTLNWLAYPVALP